MPGLAQAEPHQRVVLGGVIHDYFLNVAEFLIRQIRDGRQEMDEIKVKGQLFIRETCGADPSQVIKSLKTGSRLAAEQIESIGMLGSSESLSWSQHGDGLHVTTPSRRPCDHAYTFRIILK